MVSKGFLKRCSPYHRPKESIKILVVLPRVAAAPYPLVLDDALGTGEIRPLTIRQCVRVMARDAATGDRGKLREDGFGTGSASQVFGQTIEIAMDGHAHALEGEGKFEHEGGIDVSRLCQTPGSRSLNGKLPAFGPILMAQTGQDTVHRGQKLAHLGQDERPFLRGEKDRRSPIRTHRG